jgi:hypothetical protein
MPDCAEFVIKMQMRHLDGDVGNGGSIRREAAAEGVEIGQSSGVQLGVDGLGELGLCAAAREMHAGQSLGRDRFQLQPKVKTAALRREVERFAVLDDRLVAKLIDCSPWLFIS